MRVTTESGTQYEIEGSRVRRIEAPHALRRDDEWLDFTFMHDWMPVVGFRMILLLEPLGEGNVTIRTTTPVVSIER